LKTAKKIAKENRAQHAPRAMSVRDQDFQSRGLADYWNVLVSVPR
jgi:hypothetical protein